MRSRSSLPERRRASDLRGLWVALGVALSGCVHARTSGEPLGPDFLGEGMASFYGPGLYGHRTANGERLEPGTLTAAHRTLRFGACVRVVNLASGREVQVRINDRGPYVAGRIMDVSETAARALGMRGQGVVRVRLFRCAARSVSVRDPLPGAWSLPQSPLDFAPRQARSYAWGERWEVATWR